ncbi:MAG: PA14 domain-containing protein [Candidatus Bathyarchaeia archaeon]
MMEEFEKKGKTVEHEALLGKYVLGAIALIVVGLLFLALGLPRTETYIETVPVQVTKETVWNVTWKIFTPEIFTRVDEWVTVGYSTFPATFSYDWGSSKIYDDYGDYIGFIATATINVPRSGPVSFIIGSDDGSRLYLNGRLIIDLWWDHGYITKTVVVNLDPGKYTLTLYYYEHTVAAKVTFTADRDVLTWQETEYHQVAKQRITSNPASLALGMILIIAGGALIGVAIISRPKT